MEDIASQTGGSYLYAPDSQQLNDLYQLISGQLQNLFVATVTFVGSGNFQVITTMTYTGGNGSFTATAFKGFTYP